MRVNVRFSNIEDIKLLENEVNKSRFIRELVHQVATGELIRKSEILDWILEGEMNLKKNVEKEGKEIDWQVKEKDAIRKILEWEE